MSLNILKEIIPIVEEFTEKSHEKSLESFLVWANTKVFKPRTDNAHADKTDLLLPFLILHHNKNIKRITKEILKSSPVTSIDEYSFLLHLVKQDSFRKMELIHIHNLEAPTGIEIIKRLLKNKLISEFTDQEDRRAKRIKITSSGRKELEKIDPKITEEFKNFSSEINLSDKIYLVGILTKMMKK